MADFTFEAAPQILEACKTNASEAGGAFGRAFGGQFSMTVGEPVTLDLEKVSKELAGAGLACLLKVKSTGAALLIAESSAMIPSWYAAPDASGANKLYTLALELGMTILPESFMPDDYQAARVESLPAALKSSEIAGNAGALPLTLTIGEFSTTAWLVWPLPNPDGLLTPPPAPEPAAETPVAASGADTSSTASPAAAPPATSKRFQSIDDGIRTLPPYTRSLLKVRVPVLVTLATTKMPVANITEIVPGTIIQFEKSYEEPLTLEVGNQQIAEGEAVKVGDKFGLRVTAISMPEERFFSVKGKRAVAG